MPGTLWLVPTPIGNLGDLSSRCIQVLTEVDFIAAEDTRVTRKLLSYLGLRKPLLSYHRHSSQSSGQEVTDRLLAGESCALVSDAGTPAISDPGEELVAQCASLGIPVTSVPGPCALITALTVSGLPTGRFAFEGFLPMNRKNRQARLDSLREETRTMLFYEAPHKLVATLADLLDAFGPERRVTLCRELTKLHEEILRTTLGAAGDLYQDGAPRGEFVLVVEGAPQPKKAPPRLDAGLDLVEHLRSGEGLSLRDAVRRAAKELALPRGKLYDLALSLENGES